METCSTCKFWKRNKLYEHGKPEIPWIEGICKCEKHVWLTDYMELPVGGLGYTGDGRGEFLTSENFGCINHETIK